MKKLISKFKIFSWLWGLTALIIPFVIVSAIACSSESALVNKYKIVINTQPTDQTVYANQTSAFPSFSVVVNEIEGATFTYQWYENNTNSATGGTAIAGATSSSYTITKTDIGSVDATKYFYCEISGIVNGITLIPVASDVSTITIIGKIPSITILNQPSNQSVTIKQYYNLPTFSVVVNEIEGATFTYQWYSSTTNSTNNGTAIEGAINSSYKISNKYTKSKDTKYFYVNIQANVNNLKLTSINSHVANLTINELPKITLLSIEPHRAKAFVGQTTNLPTFTVHLKPVKDVEFSYQWYSRKKRNSPWIYIYGATSASYTVSASDVTIAGEVFYQVTINGSINGLSLTPINLTHLTLEVLKK